MRISVIVPTLNEADCLAPCLQSIRQQQPHEILVVDGGSTDSTAKQADNADHFLRTSAGRALQMNAGAEASTGEVLLFLHADCQLEEGALASARRMLCRSRVVAGCFRMRVRDEAWLYRSIDFCATMRVRLTGLIYGDQGMFVRRDVFEEISGFPNLRLMEDVYISKELRQRGRVVISPKTIHVSPRRWQRTGIIRQSLRNWTLTALAGFGVHPDRLSKWYPIVR